MYQDLVIATSKIKALEEEVKTLKVQFKAQGELIENLTTALNQLDAYVDSRTNNNERNY